MARELPQRDVHVLKKDVTHSFSHSNRNFCPMNSRLKLRRRNRSFPSAKVAIKLASGLNPEPFFTQSP